MLLGLRLSRLTGLHALFLVRALEIGDDNARLAFIAPADWLNTHSGEAVKRFVFDLAQVEAVVIFNSADVVFAGVRTRPAVLLLRKGEEGKPTHILRLAANRPKDPDAALAALAGEDTGLKGRRLRLTSAQKWADPRPRRRTAGRRLGEVARVRRGIATGRNRFFVLSEADRRKHLLRKSDLRACLSSPRLFAGTEIDEAAIHSLPGDTPRWIINARDPDAEECDDALGRYLRRGRAMGAADTYLASWRKPWFAPEHRASCPILFPYMNSTRPRFIRNRSEAVPLNTFLIIEPGVGLDADALWRALNEKRVIAQLRSLGRDYGDGMWKLEPSELARLRVTL